MTAEEYKILKQYFNAAKKLEDSITEMERYGPMVPQRYAEMKMQLHEMPMQPDYERLNLKESEAERMAKIRDIVLLKTQNVVRLSDETIKAIIQLYKYEKEN